MASNYSKQKKEEIWNKVINYMFEGQTLTKAIEKVGISTATFYNLIKDKNYPERLKEYACAREALADREFDKMLEVVTNRDADEKPFVGVNHIQRDKLIADTYKWRVGKMSSKYADSLKLQGDAENPIEQKIQVEVISSRTLKTEESEE